MEADDQAHGHANLHRADRGYALDGCARGWNLRRTPPNNNASNDLPPETNGESGDLPRVGGVTSTDGRFYTSWGTRDHRVLFTNV